jgi:DNA-binding response OmpR family regulator
MRRRVLIVDDEADTGSAMKQVLEDRGYQVSVAANGEKGMEIIRQAESDKDYIDLVVVDIELPGLSGIGLVKNLKSEKPATPSLVVAGANDKVFLINLLETAAGVENIERIFASNQRDKEWRLDRGIA